MWKLKFAGILCVLFLLLTAEAFATAQYPDKIFYNGKEYSLHSNPMEEYFKKFPDKKPESDITSSALERGYVATFEITGNELYLKDIEQMVDKADTKNRLPYCWKSFLSDIVPGGKKLKIDWFTGILILPFGKEVNYVHMGYQTTYENYVLIEIDKGDFKKSKEFIYKEYEKFKERQFEAFKKTEEYKKMYDDLKKREGAKDELINSFLKDFVTSYSSKILVD